MKEIKEFPKFIPDFCRGCKGHACYILDCDYTREEDRDLLTKVLNNYVSNEKDTITKT